MAYIRGHFYIWGDGANIHFHHGNHLEDEVCGEAGSVESNTLCPYPEDSHNPTSVTIPNYIVEEFCAMYWSRMDEGERVAAVERVVRKYGGHNFGADGIMEVLKMDSVMDVVEKNIEARREEEA